MRAGWVGLARTKRENVWPGNKVQLNGYVCKMQFSLVQLFGLVAGRRKDKRRRAGVRVDGGGPGPWEVLASDGDQCCVMGGLLVGGPRLAVSNLGREDGQPEKGPGGGEGEPRPFYPQPDSNRKPSREPVEPGTGPVGLVLLVLLSPLGH